MNYKEKELQNKLEAQNLGKSLKKEMQSFYKLHDIVYEENSLSKKTKELIALGIAISEKCEGCIIHHIRNLIDLETSRDEICDAISVSISMGGGPATVYGAKALACFDEMSLE